jgi:serine/threonine-protein kinase
MKDRKAIPFLMTRFEELYPDFSRDGRYLAYSSNETGRTEVYIRPYSGPGETVRISTDGGHSPCWAQSGRELFFLTPEFKEMMVVDVRTSPEFNAGKPRVLCGWRPGNGSGIRAYDIHPDGRRFLTFHFKEQPEAQGATEIHIVQNWFEELRRPCPPGR